MKLWGYISLAAMAILMVVAINTLPPMRGQNNPIGQRMDPYYFEHTLEHMATPNLVTSILADYRGYDTFGEATVVFTAGLACFFLLRRPRS